MQTTPQKMITDQNISQMITAYLLRNEDLLNTLHVRARNAALAGDAHAAVAQAEQVPVA